jgi:hypothetical protein
MTAKWIFFFSYKYCKRVWLNIENFLKINFPDFLKSFRGTKPFLKAAEKKMYSEIEKHVYWDSTIYPKLLISYLIICPFVAANINLWKKLRKRNTTLREVFIEIEPFNPVKFSTVHPVPVISQYYEPSQPPQSGPRAHAVTDWLFSRLSPDFSRNFENND